jgi:hypothetical protein
MSLILDTAGDSGIEAAAERRTLSTVFGLTMSTREISRMPQPFRGHWDNQRADTIQTAEIRILGDELSAATLTTIALFAIGGSAIFLDLQGGASRASNFFKAHRSKEYHF